MRELDRKTKEKLLACIPERIEELKKELEYPENQGRRVEIRKAIISNIEIYQNVQGESVFLFGGKN